MINKCSNKLTSGVTKEPDEVGSGAVNRTLPPEKTPTHRLSLLLFSIVKIGLQQFSLTTDTWDIR
jgi:hypothetical protein